MTRTDDRDYYLQRLRQARERARLATSPEARHVHVILAERYAELIDGLPLETAPMISRVAAR